MNPPSGYRLVLRRRNFWEAADAGLLLWRENFVYFLPFFALPFWTCACALRLLPERTRYLSWLVLWLLKPLFERPLLHVLSVRFFESGADMKRLCRGLGKTLFRGLAGDLLWRRFSPLRAAMMPVRTLENIRRDRLAGRRSSLRQGGLGFCFLLSLWGIIVEAALLCGEIIFFVIMAAFIQDDLISSFEEFIAKGEIFIFAAWCFNYMLVEMLYVCMGFGLYLNSRIEAEGWDIEIVFRNLGEKTKKTGLEPVVFLLCLFLGLFSPAKSFALAGGAGESGAPAELTAPNEAPLEILNSVLQSPDFGGERESWGIRLKKTPLPGKAPDVNFSPWMETLRTIFASMLRLILTALAAGLAVFLFWYFRRYRLKKNAPKDKGITTRVLEQALAESPESLLDKAERFFENGDPRPAWGYCAAAAVRSWSLYRGLAFPPNATEYDCAGMVRSAAMTANGAETAGQEGEARSFGILIGHWVNLAYGGRLPPEGSFREAAAFCRSLGRNNG